MTTRALWSSEWAREAAVASLQSRLGVRVKHSKFGKINLQESYCRSFEASIRKRLFLFLEPVAGDS